MNKNTILHVFLNQFGYREIHFLAFTKTYKITNVKALTKEFKEIQEKVYDAVLNIPTPTRNYRK